VSHYFSCLWFYVGFLEWSQNLNNWLDKFSLYSNNSLKLYTSSYYFSIVTMNTVGYGDITAQTEIEKWIVSLMILLSSGVTGYCINQIGNILNAIYSERIEIRQSLAQANQYMKKCQVESSLQSRVRKYIEYLYQSNLK
jgi:alpha-L-arabinofuranosidase